MSKKMPGHIPRIEFIATFDLTKTWAYDIIFITKFRGGSPDETEKAFCDVSRIYYNRRFIADISEYIRQCNFDCIC